MQTDDDRADCKTWAAGEAAGREKAWEFTGDAEVFDSNIVWSVPTGSVITSTNSRTQVGHYCMAIRYHLISD
jgi:hypothetical protein